MQAAPLTKIELTFEAHDLPNLDVLSKTDPQVFVFSQFHGAKTWTLVGKTEEIKDTLNPKFSKSVTIDYYFEEVQKMRFVVVDIDKPTGRIIDQDMVGEVLCNLSDIVGSRGALSKRIIHPTRQKSGFLSVRATELKDLKTNIKLSLFGRGLDKKDFFGKSDPYLTISRMNPDKSWTVVHRTEVVFKTLDPAWNAFELPLAKLNNGDGDLPLLFQCYDWDKIGKHDFIGEFTTSGKALIQGATFDLINPAKRAKKKSYHNSGTITIRDVAYTKEDSFVDYLAGGTEISLMVAIDFTASNGDQRYQNSLHFVNPYEPNSYAKAILSVGEILSAYDSDNLYPVYGFGAKVPPNSKTSHCFPLNFAPDPEVLGVKGILDVYYSALQKVTLYGPTNFAPVVKAAAERAQEFFKTKHDIQSYLILLIITDGEITDMDDTVEAIVTASYLPLSIIIVGVGSADFTNMNTLDGDDDRLQFRGRYASRDIVQFVPFRNYINAAPGKLAADTLAEIPTQFLQFMKANKIAPRPPPTQQELEQLQARQLSRTQSMVLSPLPGGPGVPPPNTNAPLTSGTGVPPSHSNPPLDSVPRTASSGYYPGYNTPSI